MRFIHSLEKGDINEFGKPDKIIETLLSKVFFFGDRVIKVYKHKEAFYGNLADFVFRKEFYSEDFFWNNSMAPEIYLKLVGVRAVKHDFAFVPLREAEDFFIEMTKIDSSKNLTNLLNKKEVSQKHIEDMTHFVVRKLRWLTKDRKKKLQKYFDIGWYKLNEEALDDLRDWAYLAGEHISRQQVDEIIFLLKNKASKEDYFINYKPDFLSVAIDLNSDNLLIFDGKPSSIDSMTPKDNWKVSDEFFNVVRVATDAYVLGSKDLADAVYKIYFQIYRKKPSDVVVLSYEIRSAIIQWAYRHVIGQHAVAEKFKEFVLGKFEQLKKS